MPNWQERVNGLVEELRCFRAGNLFNQWDEIDPNWDCENAAEFRRDNLKAYLLARPRPQYVFISEAPSWRGARFSGIPMTSERILMGGCPAQSASGRYTRRDRSAHVEARCVLPPMQTDQRED